MATTTVTASQALLNSPLTHIGVNRVSTSVVVTGTIGDTVLLARIPTGVDIIGVYGRVKTAETAATATVGFSGANTTFGSISNVAGFAVNGQAVTRVSVSDSNAIRYKVLTAELAAGTWTISADIEVTVLYVAKGL